MQNEYDNSRTAVHAVEAECGGIVAVDCGCDVVGATAKIWIV